jgi:hypothetical protein
MPEIANVTVLFIAGFGPIVREPAASRGLYAQAFGIPFKEEKGGYLHTEALPGARSFASHGLAMSLFRKPGSSSTSTTSQPPRQRLNRRAIGCWSRTGRNRGARRSAGSSDRKDCWSGSPSLRRCGERHSGAGAAQSRPPSTVSVCPVTIAAPAAKKRMTSAISAGVQARRSGVRLIALSFKSSGQSLVHGVST